MIIDDKIRDERLQYDINREVVKISALSSGKIEYMNMKNIRNEYLTGEEILPSNQRQVREQAKFACSPLRKAFKKQTKTIVQEGEKRIKAIKNRVENVVLDTNQKSIAFLLSNDFLNEEAT